MRRALISASSAQRVRIAPRRDVISVIKERPAALRLARRCMSCQRCAFRTLEGGEVGHLMLQGFGKTADRGTPGNGAPAIARVLRLVFGRRLTKQASRLPMPMRNSRGGPG